MRFLGAERNSTARVPMGLGSSSIGTTADGCGVSVHAMRLGMLAQRKGLSVPLALAAAYGSWGESPTSELGTTYGCPRGAVTTI